MPGFRLRQDELAHYKKLRAERTRNDAKHPDLCPGLTLHGVEWAIPSRGAKITPRFGAEGVEVEATADEWPEAETLLELAPAPEERACSKCGQSLQASLEVDCGQERPALRACASPARNR